MKVCILGVTALLLAVLAICATPTSAQAATYVKKSEVVKHTVKTLAVNKTYTVKAKARYESLYKIVLRNPGKLTIKLSGVGKSSDMDLWAWLPTKNRAYCMEMFIENDKASKRVYYLPAGTYYVSVLNYAFSADPIKITASFASATDNLKEPVGGSNNSLKKAKAVSLNKTYKSIVGADCTYFNTDGVDYYKFSVPYDTALLIKTAVSAELKGKYYTIYDSDGQICDSEQQGKALRGFFAKGTYYVKFYSYGGQGGTYSFNIGYGPNMTLTAPSATQAKLSWVAYPGATSYKIFKATGGGSGWAQVATTNELTYDFAMGKYDSICYRVVAVVGSTDSASSSVWRWQSGSASLVEYDTYYQ
ncbi:MAG: hypothetical protein FWF71_08050 [Actinomycetia bacterium]|nr:hypothetical protein [Actinomycetes bacterium]